MKNVKAIVVLALAALVIPAPATATILVNEVCVTIYETTSVYDDKWTLCGLATQLHNANLDGDTTGIQLNRCAGGQDDWNDCVSRVAYANLPSNYRVRWYANANYGGPFACADVNGSYAAIVTGPLDNQFSSWRVEGGNC